MNDQKNPNEPNVTNTGGNVPTNQVPDFDADAVVSTTPLTPKPGEVVRPERKVDVSDIIPGTSGSTATPTPVPTVSAPTPATEPAPTPMPKPAPVVTSTPEQSAQVASGSYPASNIPVPSVASTSPVTPPATPSVDTMPKSMEEVKIPMTPTKDEAILAAPAEKELTTPELSSSEMSVTTPTPLTSAPSEPTLPVDEVAVMPTPTLEIPNVDKPKKSKKGLVIGILATVLFLAALGGAGFILYSNGYLDGFLNPPVEEKEEVEEATESEEVEEKPVEQDTTSLKYLETLFKSLDAPVEQLRSDTNFEDTMNISSLSEF